ncbi:MAG: small subunit ribosomal protein [Myxococcales bacterium]|jgi:small subunit ribosomal protein S1|nr:small subunit ribosomal protein [Myxococcales bacterium]
MSDDSGPGAPEEDFAALMAEDDRRGGGRRRQPAYAVGDAVRGRVVTIGQEIAVVELEGGGEGTLDIVELRGPDGQLTAAVGDTVDMRVAAVGEKAGLVTLHRASLGGGAAIGGRGSGEAYAALAAAVETRIPVEGIITAINKGGVEVQVAGLRAFCPISQLDLRPVADPTTLVGQRLAFRVIRYEDDRRGPNVVLSRRALLQEEADRRAKETRRTLVMGAVLPGVVSALKDFGAFVDLGGIDGMLPASELGHTRGVRPADVLTVGQTITVQVTRIEKRDDARRPEQISLSLKSLQADPWDQVMARFPPGTLARGTVTRAEPFGVFVEIAPGVEGLLHISELGNDKRLRHGRDAAKPGEAIEVAVLAVDSEKRRLSLGLASQQEQLDDEGRAAAARAAAPSRLGTLGDLFGRPKAKRTGR